MDAWKVSSPFQNARMPSSISGKLGLGLTARCGATPAGVAAASAADGSDGLDS
jgi:hypothetical protein